MRFQVEATKTMVYSVDAPNADAAKAAVQRAVNAPLVTDQGWWVKEPEVETPPFGEPDLVVDMDGESV